MLFHCWKHHVKATGIPIIVSQFEQFFFTFYENQFMTEIISNSNIKPERLRFTKWFIADFCATNLADEYRHLCIEIYPKEHELKVEHRGNYASLLNLDIVIVDGNLLKLFSEKDSFLLWECPHIDSNILNRISY